MKILITATVQSHICQFHLPLINMLKACGHTVEVAAKNNLVVKPGLRLDNADRVYDLPFSRSPKSPDNIRAYKALKKIIKENKYDIIHCNTPMGGVVTRLASVGSGAKVIYTAHGFHFYKGASYKNWLAFYPVEWLLSFLTHTLICINNEDYTLAKKHFHAKNIKQVCGVGFDKARFDGILPKPEAREKLGIKSDETVLLSIGDLCRRKNHKVLIEALSLLGDPNARLYIAGWDMMNGELSLLAKKLGVADRVVFLGYTRHLSEYMSAADLFLFPSIQEGLPVALIEAMSCGLAVVATNIRGTSDLVCDGDGGYLLSPNDSRGFAEKIKYLTQNNDLREKFGERNAETAKKYEVEPVMKQMAEIYELVIKDVKK